MTSPGVPRLEIENLSIRFGGDPASSVVRDVTFTVGDAQTVALVGESGSGKTVTALSIARLLPEPPTVYGAGRIRLGGQDVLTLSPRRVRLLRGREVAYVFQEPSASFNPVKRIGTQIDEAVRHAKGRNGNLRAETLRLLALARVPDSESVVRLYPHELSGGLQQRAMIAMALAGKPRLLVADEPTTALDVTTQAAILDLLRSLRRELGMSILLITHNLGIVAGVADRVLVMYAGSLVECGPVAAVLRDPAHPYTRALLRAVPTIRGGRGRVEGIPGAMPDPARAPSGCRFHPRCPGSEPRCAQVEPGIETSGEGRTVRCHRWRSLSSSIP